MTFPLWMQLLSEFAGTAILMLFGNGAVANHLLTGTRVITPAGLISLPVTVSV